MRLLTGLLLLASCGHTLTAAPTLLSEISWTIDDPRFGGYSGLELSDDGQSLVAVSDRGVSIVTATIQRTDGIIAGFDNAVMTDLPNARGQIEDAWADSEGLAIAPDGTIYVSTEGWQHTVFAFSPNATRAKSMPRHPDFRHLQTNSSLEALAIGPDGWKGISPVSDFSPACGVSIWTAPAKKPCWIQPTEPTIISKGSPFGVIPKATCGSQ